MLPKSGNAIVVEVQVKGLGVGEKAWGNKEMTEPVERMVVLGSSAVGRTDNEIIAHLRTESPDVMERSASSQRESHVGVVGAVDHEQRVDRGRSIVFLIGTHQKTVLPVLAGELESRT